MAMEWTTAALMVAATLAIALAGARATPRQTARTGLCAAAAIIAALAWFATATGSDGLDTGAAEAPPYAVAWLVSTPLLLVVLSLTAAPLPRVRAASGGRRALTEGIAPLVGAMLVADLGMIWAELVAATASGVLAWTWFAARIALFALVLFVVWGPLRDASEEGHPLRAETYFRHAAILTTLWALYPILLLASPSLLAILPAGTVRVLHALVDLAALGAFPLYVVLDDKRLAEIETQDRPFPPVIRHAA